MTFKTGIFFFVILLIISCVGNDGFIEETSSTETQESVAIITLLQELRLNETTPEENLCFRFNYPITLAYNTGISIQVKDFEGFKEMVFNQTPNFNISKINFPFSVNLKESATTINVSNEQQLNKIVSECGLSTTRESVERLVGVCYDYKYPIQLLDTTNNSKTINNLNEFNNFIKDQGAIYQPQQVFPFDIILPTNEVITINSYFEFYTIWNSCVCIIPDFSSNSFLTIPNPQATKIRFEINPIQENFHYEWFLNDQSLGEPSKNNFIAYEQPIPIGDNIVCVHMIHDCNETFNRRLCDDYKVKECPELSFSRLDQDLLLARFGNAQIQDKIIFAWTIDGQPNNQPTSDPSRNGLILENLKNGTYEICVLAKAESCTQEAKYCESVVINSCPEPNFTYSKTGYGLEYLFVADFAKKNTVQYEWIINDKVIKIDGLGSSNTPDHSFTVTFNGAIDHNVCIRTRPTATGSCQTATQKCQVINVQ